MDGHNIQQDKGSRANLPCCVAVFSINCSKDQLFSLQLSSLKHKANNEVLTKFFKYIKLDYRHTQKRKKKYKSTIQWSKNLKITMQDIHTQFQGRRSHFNLTTNWLKGSQLSCYLRLKRVWAISVRQIAIGAISLRVSFLLIINSNQLSKQKIKQLYFI